VVRELDQNLYKDQATGCIELIMCLNACLLDWWESCAWIFIKFAEGGALTKEEVINFFVPLQIFQMMNAVDCIKSVL